MVTLSLPSAGLPLSSTDRLSSFLHHIQVDNVLRCLAIQYKLAARNSAGKTTERYVLTASEVQTAEASVKGSSVTS